MLKTIIKHFIAGAVLSIVLYTLADFSLVTSIFVGIFTGILSFFSLDYKKNKSYFLN